MNITGINNIVLLFALLISCVVNLPIEDEEEDADQLDIEIDNEEIEDMLNTTVSRIVNDPIESNSNKSALSEKLDVADDLGVKIVSNAQNIFGSLISIASNLFDIKTKAAVQGIDTASKTAEAISNSETAGKIIDTGTSIAKVAGEGAIRLGETVAVGGKIVGDGLSTAGAVAAPVVLNTAMATVDGVEAVTRAKICLFICPFQKGEEKENCRKQNCGKIDRSDNLDYYDGDFRGDWV